MHNANFSRGEPEENIANRQTSPSALVYLFTAKFDVGGLTSPDSRACEVTELTVALPPLVFDFPTQT